eukprot:6189135-Pleurochrysis_carterae.AAC.1
MGGSHGGCASALARCGSNLGKTTKACDCIMRAHNLCGLIPAAPAALCKPVVGRSPLFIQRCGCWVSERERACYRLLTGP